MESGNQCSADPRGLGEASFRAFKWDYAGTATRAFCSVIVTVVLARLLGPEPFGLVAAGWLVIGAANIVADLGLGPALLQRRSISDQDIRHAFTMQIGMGLGLMAATALAAPLMARAFNEPKVAPVTQAMSLVFLLQTFSGVAVSLLKRQMDFKRIQVARITSYFAGFLGLGIPLALLGFDVWSLVIAQLSQTALFSFLCYVQVRHPIKPILSLDSSGLNQFGFKVLSTNLVNYLISNLDTFFIGRFFDVITLGLYNRIFVLVSTPMNTVVATVQQVTFAAYSRIQDKPEVVRRGYLAGFGFMTVLMLPGFGCVALVPGTVIDGLFGNQWEAAIPLLVPLALTMPFHAVLATGGPILWANNRVGRELLAQIITACALVIVLFATSRISAVALAWGVLGTTILRFLLITNTTLKTVEGSWGSILPPVYGSLVLLVLTGSTVSVSDWTFRALQVAAFHRLLLDMVVGSIIFIISFLLIRPFLFSPEMYWLAGRLTEVVPMRVRPLLRRLSPSPSVGI